MRFREKCTSVPFAELQNFLAAERNPLHALCCDLTTTTRTRFRPFCFFFILKDRQSSAAFLILPSLSFFDTAKLAPPAQDECAGRPRAAGCDRNLLWQFVQLHCLYHWCMYSIIPTIRYETLLTQCRRVKQRLSPTKTEVRRLMHAHILANANLSTRPPNPHRPVLRRGRRAPRWSGQAPDCPQCEEHRRILPRFPRPGVGNSSLCALCQIN